VSFARYLHEHRDAFVDLRIQEPSRPGVTLDEEAVLHSSSGPSRSSTRPRWRGGGAPEEPIRFRHVKPAFAPSPFHDPLPFLEPSERR
jgi:hypothetical protein